MQQIAGRGMSGRSAEDQAGKVTMKLTVKLGTNILIITLALLSFVIESPAQRDKRVQQQEQATQTNPLVRAFRGRGKSEKDLPRAEKLEIGGDQLGQILKANTTLVRLSVHTSFVPDLGYLTFRSGDSSHPRLNQASPAVAEVNGLIGKARFTGLRNEIEIGIKPKPNKLYMVDVSLRHAPNCDRCAFSITGPDDHTESWDPTQSESQHLYFTIITNDSDWYVLMLRGGTFEFEWCAVHEVQPL